MSRTDSKGQLSLFEDTSDTDLVDNSIEESVDERNQRIHPTRTSDPRTLEASSTGDGGGTGQSESASAGDLRGPGIDGESPVRVEGGSEDGLSAGVGDRDPGVGLSSGRGRSAPSIVRSSDPGPAPTLARDLRITSAHGIGEGSLRQKAQANLAAIRILKILEADNRAG